MALWFRFADSRQYILYVCTYKIMYKRNYLQVYLSTFSPVSWPIVEQKKLQQFYNKR